jgi:hypothetical protein
MSRTTIKERGHEGEPNKTIEAHFTLLGDVTCPVQNARRLPHANNFLYLKIIN